MGITSDVKLDSVPKVKKAIRWRAGGWRNIGRSLESEVG